MAQGRREVFLKEKNPKKTRKKKDIVCSYPDLWILIPVLIVNLYSLKSLSPCEGSSAVFSVETIVVFIFNLFRRFDDNVQEMD